MIARYFACAASLFLAALSILPVPAPAQGPAPLPAERGVTFSGRILEVYSITSVDSIPRGDWTLRRVRVGARFRLNSVVSGRIQPDYSADHFSFKDAYLQFEARPDLRVLVGQSQRPFSPLARANELRVPVIEKTAGIRGLGARDAQTLVQSAGYSSRDLGVQLLGTVPLRRLPVEYELALLQGPLAHAALDLGGYQLGARVSAVVAPQVRVGAAWSRRDFPSRTSGGLAETRNGDAFVGDVEIGGYREGPHFLAEVITGDLDPGQVRSFRALHALASYRLDPHSALVSGVEPGLRASAARVRGGAPESGLLLTPALSAYLHHESRITLNYDLWQPESGEPTMHDWKLLLQLAF